MRVTVSNNFTFLHGVILVTYGFIASGQVFLFFECRPGLVDKITSLLLPLGVLLLVNILYHKNNYQAGLMYSIGIASLSFFTALGAYVYRDLYCLSYKRLYNPLNWIIPFEIVLLVIVIIMTAGLFKKSIRDEEIN
jgi:hypothetical protein